MITLKKIIDLVRPALASDTELQDYCMNMWGKEALIFVGVDTANPPAIESMPYISIIPYNKDVGQGEYDFSFNFFFDVVIEGSEKPVVTGNIVEYDGIYLAEELSLHVQRVVTKAVCGMDEKVFYIPAEVRTFPVYGGIISLEISSPNVIGSDELTIGG